MKTVIVGFYDIQLNSGEQITVDEMIWEILEGDPREDASGDEEHPRAIKDDARICIILDCCRFHMIH